MRHLLDRREDYVAGIVTGLIGLYIVVQGLGYRMGTLEQMGPGYFPVILGGVMVVLALVMLVTARPSEGPVTSDLEEAEAGPGQLRGMALLAAAFIGFALTIEPLGMVPSIAIAVFLSSLANPNNGLRTALVLALATAVVCALVFRLGLGLQIKAF